MAGITGLTPPRVGNLVDPRATARGVGVSGRADREGQRALLPPVDGEAAATIRFSPEAQALLNPQDQEAEAPAELTEDEQQEVDQLQQRDREVRQHEQAHVAAAGQYAQGGPQYEFTQGPDGRQYATGGHVNIDVSPESTPEATLAKARVVRRAALAPAEPSPADRAVAAEASQLETGARREIQEQRQAENEEAGEGNPLVAEASALSGAAIQERFDPRQSGPAGPSRLDYRV